MINISYLNLTTFNEVAKSRVAELLMTLVLVFVVGLLQFTKMDQIILNRGRQLGNPFLLVNINLAKTVNSTVSSVRQQQLLARRVQDLELKLAQTYVQLGELDQLEKENQQLRQLLNSTDRTLNRVVLTQPILSFAQPVVSIPRDMEIIEGSAVLIEGTLIGLIKEKKNDVAVVSLLWQKDAALVLAETSSGVQGIVRGDGRRVIFTEIPIDEEIEIGQRVLTAGQRGVEGGLFVGEIRSIISGESSAVKTAVLEQYVSFYQASLVEIRL